ncbi:MAG: BMP family ABC transporter substrate-binding protein [Oscillospiraceae bacterium]|nr:BMP family ABC transporter substrate-binding protein [Oscillospiraceae bacterium]
MKKKAFTLLSLLLACVLVLGLAACGSSGSGTSAGSGTAASGGSNAAPAAETKLRICIITSSGVDDGSFNENCYDGIKAFIAEHPDCTVTDVKESDLSKLIETVDSLVGSYDVFVLPGFNFAACGDIVTANPDKYFIVVDSTITDSEGNAVTGLSNAYTMTFKEEEGGFMAGLAAALSTQTGKVAVVNGIAFPSNVNYQFGFMAGVNYANAKFGTSAEYVEIPSFAGSAAVPVEGMGADVGGNYVGDFANQAQGKVVAEELIRQGVDIIFPAAGSSGNGCFTAVKEAGSGFAIGCDVDQYDDGDKGDGTSIILTSALKVMDQNIQKQLNAIYDGTFQGEDALLGVTENGIGYVSAAGRQQLSEDALAKMAEAYASMKAGDIVPPSNFNGYLPTDFPGLS